MQDSQKRSSPDKQVVPQQSLKRGMSRLREALITTPMNRVKIFNKILPGSSSASSHASPHGMGSAGSSPQNGGTSFGKTKLDTVSASVGKPSSEAAATHPGPSDKHSVSRELKEEAVTSFDHRVHPGTSSKAAKGSIECYTLMKTLGTGSFGRVFLAKLKDDPSAPPVAIKRLKKVVVIHQKQVDHITSEKKILSAVKHPFLVEMSTAFKDDCFLYVVMEYVAGGEFFTHLRRSRRFENEAARFYAAQIVCIFDYLHAKNIIYRDLKPENILVARDGYLKLTDFGFAKVIEYRTYTLCGTPEYIAPEVLLNKGHGKPVDWWTLGILIFEMLVGYPPFFDDEPMGIYQKILAGRITFPRHFDKHAKSLVKRLLTHDLAKRFGNLRGGAEDIKMHKWFLGLDWDTLLQKQLPPPYIPVVKSAEDTSNFENYPESTDEPDPVTGPNDPFNDW